MKRILVACLALLILAAPAFADGGYAPRIITVGVVPDMPDLPSQRAIIVYEGGIERLIVQSDYQGQIEEFAWIIPVPALVNAGDVKIYNDSTVWEDLSKWTQPRISWVEHRGGGGGKTFGFGCSSGKSKSADYGANSQPGNNSVTVHEEMRVGPYDVTVLSATNASILMDWLNSNDYYMPPAGAAAVDFYVQKSWYFLAVKVAPDLGIIGTIDRFRMPALDISFPAAQPVYPMRLTSTIPNFSTIVTLYIFGFHRAAPENMPSAEFELNAGQYTRMDYDMYFALQPKNTFITEYANLVSPDTSKANLSQIISGDMWMTRMSIDVDKFNMLDDFFFNFGVPDRKFKYNKTIITGTAPVGGGKNYPRGLEPVLLLLVFLLMFRTFFKLHRRRRPAFA